MPELESVDKMAHVTEQYVDAHGCMLGNKAKKRDSGPLNRSSYKPGGQVVQTPQGANGGGRSQNGNGHWGRRPECFICHRTGHFTKECKVGQQPKQEAAGAQLLRRGQIDQGRVKAQVQSRRGQEEPQTESRTACQAANRRLEAIQACMEGGNLKLANGEAVPLVSGACDKHYQLPADHCMPVREGFVGKQKVQVLRDTGCSTVAVRADLVRPDQITGEAHMCVLIDGTIHRFPLAKVHVNTPYYVGIVKAMCMRRPICDLVIGNLPGAKDANVGAPGVSQTQEGEWLRVSSELLVGVAPAVVTRAQAKKANKQMRLLVVRSMPDAPAVGVEELKKAQKDPALDKLWALAQEGSEFVTRDHEL